jgi:small subunit ribosomal protein S2
MKPYIFGKRNLIHILNIKETLKGILLAKKFLIQVVSDGKDVLLVGTKRQARKSVEENAQRVNMHWVNDRWLGGTLTNFREIRKRVGRLDYLEQLEKDGLLDQYSKKEGSTLRREMKKIQRNLGGIRKMERFPGVLVIVDQRREMIAIKEAKKAGIPVICLLDTDCDPDVVDIPIPGNDDGMRCIEIVIKELCDAVAEGLHGRQERAAENNAEDDAGQKRRSRRPSTSRVAEEAAAIPSETPAVVAAEQAPTVETKPEGDAPAQA